MRFGKNLIISFGGIFLALLCVEGLFRLFHNNSAVGPREDRPQYYYIPEGSFTLQDAAHTPDKNSDVFRISVVGDSFSFGPEMQYDDVFAKRLERMGNLNGNSKKLEVINMGSPGFSTQHEIELVRKAVAIHSDLILLQITLNDPELKSLKEIREQFGPLNPKGGLRTLISYWHSLGFVLERLHNQKTIRYYKQFHYDLFEKPESWGRFSKAIKDMQALCQSHAVPLVAVVFPLFDFPLDETYPFQDIHKKITSYLKDLDIPRLDLFRFYEGMNPLRLQTIPGRDSHPNEIAHRIAAESIYRWLIKGGMLPPEFLANRMYNQRGAVLEKHMRVKWGTENDEPAQNELVAKVQHVKTDE